jgi:flavin reductase (DIM6/NTAB) family NADH-FMN oxidoreductase RutF
MKRSLGPKTLAAPVPVWLVATYDVDGKPNFMTAAWGCICSSQPPCLTVSLRSATYSHSAIVKRQAYTVNVPSSAQVAEADYGGIVSGRDVDKFAACKFNAVRSGAVDAPYIEQALLVLECRLINTLEVGIHTMFIGEIVDVKADESVLIDGRTLDVERLSPIVYDTAQRAYLGIGSRLGSAWQIGKSIGREATGGGEKTE